MKFGRWKFNKKVMNEEKNNTPVDENGTDQQQPEINTDHELPAEPENASEKRIAQLEEQVSAANDKYLRLYSEFDNYRKRTIKERADLLQTAGADVIKNLLPVLDDFERAVRNNETATDLAAVNEGIKLVASKFQHVLTKLGLEQMNATGQPFDVDLHEAITNIPAPTEELKGKVVDEVEKGYTLSGKVIRFAKVVVGS